MPLSPLAPEPARQAHELLAAVRPRERAPADRPFVFANMISTADGRAASGGTTEALGGDADLELLLELRAIADAVLIGPGTLSAEGYDRLVRSAERRERRIAAGLAPDPLAVVISRSGNVPFEAGLFQAPQQPVLVYTSADVALSADVPARLEIAKLEDLTPAAALADLRARGIRALLCEGGPTLLGALLAAGLVDELFLTLAPLLTGEEDAPQIVAGGRLPAPAKLELLWTLRAGDELFVRYAI
jgi:riboflavin-specific deaminase-like protein